MLAIVIFSRPLDPRVQEGQINAFANPEGLINTWSDRKVGVEKVLKGGSNSFENTQTWL